MENLNRPLTPEELEQLKRQKALERAENALDQQWKELAEEPSKWFGRCLALGVVSFFLDAVGWFTAFLSPRLNAVLNLFLKFSMSIAILGMAGLAIAGLILGYRHEQAKKRLRETFVFSERPPEGS